MKFFESEQPKDSTPLNAEEKALKKSYKIFILASVFFAAGLFFFARQYIFPSPGNQNEDGQQEKAQLTLGAAGGLSAGGNLSVSSPQNPSGENIRNYPPPEIFREFHYSGTLNSIEVSGSCKDAYYAILIYEVGRDYREDPASAKYNTAFLCPPDKKFAQKIDLVSLRLKEGDYYIIRASLPERGMWYDPY